MRLVGWSIRCCDEKSSDLGAVSIFSAEIFFHRCDLDTLSKQTLCSDVKYVMVHEDDLLLSFMKDNFL